MSDSRSSQPVRAVASHREAVAPRPASDQHASDGFAADDGDPTKNIGDAGVLIVGSGSAVLKPTAAPANGETGHGSSVNRLSATGSTDQEDRTVISKTPPVLPPTNLRPISSHELGQALIGKRLSHFTLEEFVGGGGMGAVFKARDSQLARTVAVKVLSREQSGDSETLRRFRNEAQSAARLDHENIARVYFVGEDDSWHFIVFEYIEGTNIRDLVLRYGPLSLDDAVSYTLQTAEALDHAAHRDVVHRDIKPSNVLITADGHAKLVDMGLARLHQVEAPENDLTASGVTLGTFDYISPEQARDPRSADVRSDIYSLGCTLYFMLTGRPPFPEGTVLQKLLSHSSEAPPDPRQFRPDLPDELTGILAKMMAKDPAARYQQPAELIGGLLLLADRLNLEVRSRAGAVWITPNESRPSWLDRHLPWLAPTLVLVLLVIALDVISAWRRPSEPTDSFTAPKELPRAVEHSTKLRGNESPPVSNGPTTNGNSTSGNGSGTHNSAKEAGSAKLAQASPGDTSPTPATEIKTPASADSKSPLPGDDSTKTAAKNPPGDTTISDTPADPMPASKTPGETAKSPADMLPPMPEVMKPKTAIAQVIVDPLGKLAPLEGVPVVRTLQAACGLALKNPGLRTIELHFDGVLREEPFSFTLTNANLKICAGRNSNKSLYSPVILFRPLVEDYTKHRGRMIALAGGELKLEDVHLEMNLPASSSERWSMFEVQAVRKLEIVNSTLTIRNASESQVPLSDNAAFIDLMPLPGRDTMPADQMAMMDSPTTIDLKFSAVRGEADFVRAAEGQPLKLWWENGLLATSERLVSIGGSRTIGTRDHAVDIELRHLTAHLGKGLGLLASTTDAPRQLLLKAKAEHCVIVAPAGAPLWEQRGGGTLDDLQNKFDFTGRRNCYDGPAIFWRIAPNGEEPAQDLSFTDWKEHKRSVDEMYASSAPLVWKAKAPASTPIHRLTVAQFVLADPSTSADRTQENDSGLQASRLAEFPDAGGAVIPATGLPTAILP